MPCVALVGVAAALVWGCTSRPCPTVSQAENASASEKANAATATPLILEKDEGERRVGAGLAVTSEPGRNLRPQDRPEKWRLAAAGLVHGRHSAGRWNRRAPPSPCRRDFVLYERNGSRSCGKSGEGCTCRVDGIHPRRHVDLRVGPDPVSAVAIFSALGFEQFMRVTSAREGEENVPLSKAENDELMRD